MSEPKGRQKSERGGGMRALMILAGVVIVIAGLKSAGPLILPLIVSLFLAVLSLPLLRWLEERRVPRQLAVLLTILTVIAVVLGAGLLVGGTITGFTQALPRYVDRVQEMAQGFIDWLETRHIDVPEEMVGDLLNPGAILTQLGKLLTSLTTLFSRSLIVLLTTVFVLLEAAVFPEKLRAAFGHISTSSSRLDKIKTEIQRYLAIKTSISLTTGLLVGLGTWALGIDFPLLWGLLAFILNYIPSLGSIFAAIPTVMLTLVQHGPGRAIGVAAIYLVINIALGNFLEPMLMGRRLGLSTLVVFTSMVFWGWIWGPLGMLLSVPLTMIIKIMLEYSDEFRWMAVLLDARPPERLPGEAATSRD